MKLVLFSCYSGFPAEVGQKMVNTHWYCRVKRIDSGNSVVVTMRCDELPEVNGTEVFVIGKETEIDNPVYMGKAKVCEREPL